MIGIIDFGLGNLISVAGAVEKLGFVPKITSDIETLRSSVKLILPGVGAFGDGIRNLTDHGLIEPLTQMVVQEKKPILGICLGSQLMAKTSEEFGSHLGLGWIDGHVKKLKPNDTSLRVPHVGWNELKKSRKSFIFEGIEDNSLFYYVHSYCIEVEDQNIVAGTCDYGGEFVSAIEYNNIVTTQFHPEKSQQSGLTLLNNFLKKI